MATLLHTRQLLEASPGFEEDNLALQKRRPHTSGWWNEDRWEVGDIWSKPPVHGPLIFRHQKWRGRATRLLQVVAHSSYG